jgi:hypothetical protein
MTQQSLHLLAARFLGQHVGSTAPLFLAFLAVHVVAGTTAVITGATAALAHKPGARHLRAGRRYYRAIIVLSGTGAALAIMRWPEDAYLLVIAAVMVTAATIGVRARRRRNRAGGTIHILGLSLSFVAMMTGFYVDNGPHLPLLDHLPTILFWVLPPAAGAVLTGRAVRRAARGHYDPGGHHLAVIQAAPAGVPGTPGPEGPPATLGPGGVADDG